MSVRFTYFVIPLLLLFLIACSKKESDNTLRFQGPSMGTQYHVTVVFSEAPSRLISSEIQKSIDKILLEINQQMSTYIPNSEISRFNQSKSLNWFPVSEDFAFVVSNAQIVSKQSQGMFDITVAPLIDLWGFGAKTQLIPPTEKQIQALKKDIGFKLLDVRIQPPALRKQNKNIRIDLSAIAKGFAVDKVSEYLQGKGFSHYLVEIGGEVRVYGMNQLNKPWRIGIQTPELNKKGISDSLLLSNISLATSGDYRNYFIKNGVRYSHTLNPVTGKPITHNLASITVLHKSSMMADAYATALTVMGESAGKVFVSDNNLHVNMIAREKDSYRIWENIKEIKIKQTAQNCQKEGGCCFLERPRR